jgi:hypothetical protein
MTSNAPGFAVRRGHWVELLSMIRPAQFTRRRVRVSRRRLHRIVTGLRAGHAPSRRSQIPVDRRRQTHRPGATGNFPS